MITKMTGSGYIASMASVGCSPTKKTTMGATGWEGTVTGRLVAALSMTWRQEQQEQEQQDHDDIHPWFTHELPIHELLDLME